MQKFNLINRDCHLLIHEDCIPLTGCIPCSFTFNDEKISNSFFKVFTSLMKNYRTFFDPKTAAASDNEGEGLAALGFKKDEFILDFESEIRPFIKGMVESQAFAQFLQDRIQPSATEYDVMVFDESIKQKLNRSRLRFSKEPTPFLNETSYQISTKYFTLDANLSNIPQSIIC